VVWKPAARLVKFTVAVMMIGAFPGGRLYAKHWNVVLLHATAVSVPTLIPSTLTAWLKGGAADDEGRGIPRRPATTRSLAPPGPAFGYTRAATDDSAPMPELDEPDALPSCAKAEGPKVSVVCPGPVMNRTTPPSSCRIKQG
jgi:hypothetical protein